MKHKTKISKKEDSKQGKINNEKFKNGMKENILSCKKHTDW